MKHLRLLLYSGKPTFASGYNSKIEGETINLWMFGVFSLCLWLLSEGGLSSELPKRFSDRAVRRDWRVQSWRNFDCWPPKCSEVEGGTLWNKCIYIFKFFYFSICAYPLSPYRVFPLCSRLTNQRSPILFFRVCLKMVRQNFLLSVS